MKVSSRAILFSILILATILRLWGITAGLPYVKIHIDENAMVNLALALYPLKGTLWTSGSGFLMPYLLFFVYGVYYLCGRFFGLYASPEDFLATYLASPGDFTLLGRLFNVSIAVGTVLLLYIVGKKWFGLRVGLLASFFLAVSFVHVKESHYVKNDILAGFFTILVYHYSCLIVQNRLLKNYILAGIMVGLAFGTKVFPIISIVTPLIAHFILFFKGVVSIFDKKMFIFVISIVVTISALTYKTLSDPGGVGELLRIGNVIRETGQRSTTPPIITYIWEHLREGVGISLLLTGFYGLAISLFHRNNYKYLLLLTFPALFLFSVQFWGQYNLPRHVIVFLPHFLLLSAIGVTWIFKKSLLIIPIAFLFVLPTLERSVKMDIYLSGTDTREIAKYWIENNVTNGSRVVVEGTLKPYIPGGAAPLYLSEEGVLREIEKAKKVDASGLQVKNLLRANRGRIAFDILATPKIDREYDTVLGKESQLKSTEIYKNGGFNTVVTLSWAHYWGLDKEFQNDFEDNYLKVVEFKPDIDFSASMHDTIIEYDNLDRIALSLRPLIVGPTVTVFQLKK